MELIEYKTLINVYGAISVSVSGHGNTARTPCLNLMNISYIPICGRVAVSNSNKGGSC